MLICLLIFILPALYLCYPEICPDGFRIRKEVRDLTRQELLTYKRAIKALQNEINEDGLSTYENFTRIHIKATETAHFTPQFLPWHRLFILEFENHLRRIEPSVTLPYWDWSFDAADPLSSLIFTKEYFYIQPGPQGDCSLIYNIPRRHCLKRNYNPDNFTTFVDRNSLNRLIKRSGKKYDTFRKYVEATPHIVVHAELGGQGGDLTVMHSPNDPIFWLHHGMMDKIWWEWQTVSGNMYGYDGTHMGVNVSSRDIISPWAVRVRDTLDIDSLCYRYEPFSWWKNNSRDRNETAPVVPPKPAPKEWIDMMEKHNQSIQDFLDIQQEIQDIIVSKVPDQSLESGSTVVGWIVWWIIPMIFLII